MDLTAEWADGLAGIETLSLQDHGESLWFSLSLCLSRMHAQIVYSPFLRLSLTCVHTQSELEWKHSSKGRQTNNTPEFFSSVLMKVGSRFLPLYFSSFHYFSLFLLSMYSPSSPHLCCLYHNIRPVPSAPGTNYPCLSTAMTGCLCLSLTPYGPLCMFGCMTPEPSPLPSDLQIETRSGLIFRL